jgi:hypothetical protein
MTIRSLLKAAIRSGLRLSAPLTAYLPRAAATRVFTYHEVLPAGCPCPDPYNQVAASLLSRSEPCYWTTSVRWRFSTRSGAAPPVQPLVS